MRPLQVRDFPDVLYAELRERAKREHRSIAQQTIVAVETYLQGQKGLARTSDVDTDYEIRERVTERMALFEWINSRPPVVVPEGFPSPEELIREDRDTR